MQRVKQIDYNIMVQYNTCNITGLMRLICKLYTIVDINNELSIMSFEDLERYVEKQYHCFTKGECIHLNEICMCMCAHCVIDIINQGIEDCELILYYKD